MEELKAALQRFLEQQDLYNAEFGLFEEHEIRLRPEPVHCEIDEQIPVSPELMYLYSHYEMRDSKAQGTQKLRNAAVEIGDAAVLFFAAPEHLHRQQLGYRWIGQSEPYRESETWPRQHVVIANFNDDPLIVDTSVPGSPVYAGVAGGRPECVASSLGDLFLALAILIEGARAFGGEVVDEETYETKPAYLEQVEPPLRALLGAERAEHLCEFLSFNIYIS
ncbi:hypothetical protein D1872_247790 [compost metagenome]